MKVLAVDYGKRRIGLALGDTNLKIAVPLGSIENRNQRVFEEISQRIKELGISVVLLGLPLTPSGREGERAKEVKDFLEALKSHIPEGVEIILWDERYTTKEAYSMMEGLKWKKKKELKDSISAYAILLEYLESL
ncbi:MAG: Holliday junction resolvase RuvX [Aquificaceae bacterium]